MRVRLHILRSASTMKPFILFLLVIASVRLLSAVESAFHPPIGLVLAVGGFNESIEVTIEEDGRYISTYDQFYCVPAEGGTIGRGGTETGRWKLTDGIVHLYPDSEFRSWISGRDFSIISKLENSDVRDLAVEKSSYEKHFGKFVLLDKSSGILLVFDPDAVGRIRSRNYSSAPQGPQACSK